MKTNKHIRLFNFLLIFFICFTGIAQDNFENLPTTSNWSSSEIFDITGQIKSRNVSFFDNLGKLLQSQSKDVKTNRIWATQIMYDSYGRPAFNTLSAPVGTTFEFRNSFVRKPNNNNYLVSDFENNPQNPSVVGTQSNTLGHYYSNNNSTNPFQDITSYPFSRTIYSTLNPGIPLKKLGGNKVNGKWLQSYSFSMPASQELAQNVAFGDTKYNSIRTIKTITRDVHGNETVVFNDTDGRVLAAARSNGSISRGMSIVISDQGFVDIHVPVGNNTGFTVDANGYDVTVYDLITEKTVSASNSLPNGFYRVSVADPDTYDPDSPVTVSYHENYYDYTLNEYDAVGRVIATYQPLGTTKASKPKTTYEYNTMGELVYSESVDEGKAWFRYRSDGQIRFSQNEKQRENGGYFSYTHYDKRGRPVESGVYRSNSSVYFDSQAMHVSLDAVHTFEEYVSDADFLKNTYCSERLLTAYDRISQADETFLSGVHSSYDNPTFLAGNVAKTWNDNTTTYYSYDIYGRVQWVVQNIIGLGSKTIDYTYDPVTSQVILVDYQKNVPSERFIHRYSYDPVDNSLIKVETSTNNQIFAEHAAYEYYETGGLKKVNLAQGLQEIDYVYNLNGALKSINHPSLTASNDPSGNATDLFGMNIHYYQGDYLRNTTKPVPSISGGIDQYNGNIKAITWNTNKEGQAGTPDTYYYEYDKNNWLKGASFNQSLSGPDLSQNPEEMRDKTITVSETVKASQSIALLPGFSITSSNSLTFTAKVDSKSEINTNGDYNVYDITYDANGNIQSLNRNKNTANGSNSMDKLSYQYKTDKPNQLLRVDDAVGSVSDADDIEDQEGNNYVYNEIGQLIKNNEENIEYLYNASGLVTEVKKDGNALVKFFYNDKGHRVRKESYNPSNGTLTYAEFYVRDASGTSLSIYRKDSSGTRPVEYTVYGSSRLGVYKPSDFSYLYQLTDHLGNVRAVVRTTDDGDAVAAVATDYYPFGMPMPGRDLQGDYRYAYQGQEKDTETGKEAFELRLWDSRIGRWLTTDPYGQFNSPYLGMHNNPISAIDPDGGFSWLGAQWFKLWHGGEISKVENDYGSYYKVTGFGDEGSSIAIGRGAVPTREGAIKAITENFQFENALNNNGFENRVSLDYTSSRLEALGKNSQFALPSAKIKWPFKSSKPTTSGTVWDDIVVTQSSASNSVLPKSFEMATNSGKVWVHPNATKHMAEYVGHLQSSGRLTKEALNLSTQVHLKSFHSAVSKALKNGIKYDELINVGGWELIFSAPRKAGLLPVIKHALGK